MPYPKKLAPVLLMILAHTAGCGDPGPDGGESLELVAASPTDVPLTFEVPRLGTHHVFEARPDLACARRIERREFDVPAGAVKLSVSPTAKTLCFTLGGDTFCHVSGTGTGFCDDLLDNVVNSLIGPSSTIDSQFVEGFLAGHRAGRAILSGHSQGAYDISRVAPTLRPDDQLVLLQPASAALTPNRPLLDAIARGVHVHVGFSPGDIASIGLENRAGLVPIITFPNQDPAIRIHNPANARALFLQRFTVDRRRTFNPAIDASILSNPLSPQGPWPFPEWR